MGAFLSVHYAFLRNLPFLLAFRKKRSASIQPKILNIFELPEEFLNKLMRKMQIRDRLNLRLTCRQNCEFESLVADSHAGYFERGKIVRDKHDKDKIFAFIGEGDSAIQFTHFDFNEIGVQQIKLLRSRLFRKISISGIFQVELDSNVLTLEELRNILENFELEKLCLIVNRESLLEGSITLFSNFPESKCSLNLRFLPEKELLLSLPRLEGLFIQGKDKANHFITLFFVSAFLTETEAHSVEIMLKHSIIIIWLGTHGISEDTESEDVCGEFTAIHISVSRMHLQFDYKSSGPNREKCRIRVKSSTPLWSNENDYAILTMEKDWQ
ncbi:hypothetical protein PRIPAC_78993 [Pristionchus pacificus]|uniref:F-box domain-containing protein n=1 Tax=Pristionchus pacificus TaxID=54126 RepID=A0A2A6CMB5_PRIPA|nr:hypothetical protein PRIPAC_78993 [Pristionchus pacificus]|eukprot:PDM79227.1 hypothetical protein PRIPAC_31806 [Pristionchus pacificus]